MVTGLSYLAVRTRQDHTIRHLTCANIYRKKEKRKKKTIYRFLNNYSFTIINDYGYHNTRRDNLIVQNHIILLLPTRK